MSLTAHFIELWMNSSKDSSPTAFVTELYLDTVSKRPKAGQIVTFDMLLNGERIKVVGHGIGSKNKRGILVIDKVLLDNWNPRYGMPVHPRNSQSGEQVKLRIEVDYKSIKVHK